MKIILKNKYKYKNDFVGTLFITNRIIGKPLRHRTLCAISIRSKNRICL